MTKSHVLLFTTAALALSASCVGAAASDVGAVKSTIRETIAKANAGRDLSADFDENCASIDEFAPFSWSKFAGWMSAAGPFFSQNGITDNKTKLNGFRHVNVKNGRAYAVIDVVYSFKQNGKAHREPGLEVMTLKHADPGWKIDSFAWVGRTGADAGADAKAITAAVQEFASLKHEPSPDPQAITDEFPPYAWNGASASTDWYAGLQKLLADGHTSSIVLAPSTPSELQINGDRAYAAFPTLITTKTSAKTMREKGSFAFAFRKTAGTWHITSWAWATQ
jgi:hypothetical protein